MIGTASRQSVVRGGSGRLFVRVMDDTTFTPYEVNANGHSCNLYDSNGGLVANASSGFSISEEHLTLTYLFSSSEWSLQDFCKAHFSISTTNGTIEREIYFRCLQHPISF